MNNSKPSQYTSVNAAPVKSFFVSMLTRDIKLEEAILDLLDNCVDGILRSDNKGGTRPYEHYRADITFDANSFTISDNCGGIPWDLHDYAFRMGRPPNRPPENLGSVGVYGIGMKRAIFKIGEHCTITTQNSDHQYEVEISPEWINDESTWKIPVRHSDTQMDPGSTKIVVSDLHSGIASKFEDEATSFMTGLAHMISTHYAYIIDKGFEVTINETKIHPRTTKITLSDQEMENGDIVKPYVYRGKIDEVDVFLAVGFSRFMPSENEILDDQESVQHSCIIAGWTILCNDRAVLYCDRSEMTGWGEAGVPRFHNQFMAISGIVDFRSKDPSKLPTTTTKRGIDASSPLYLKVKNRMREGMRVFTNYTNKWKSRADESVIHFQQSRKLSLEELKVEFQEADLKPIKSIPPGLHLKPSLPMPPTAEKTKRRISFSREIDKIKTIADYLDDPDMEPSEVGEYCFDVVFEEVDF